MIRWRAYSGGPAIATRSVPPYEMATQPSSRPPFCLDDLGRFAKHPRTSFAQPHDKIGGIADGGKLHRAAMRQRRRIDNHQVIMAGQIAKQMAHALYIPPGAAALGVAPARQKAHARVRGRLHRRGPSRPRRQEHPANATPGPRPASGPCPDCESWHPPPARCLPGPGPTAAPSRATIIVLPWPSAGLVNSSTCERPRGNCRRICWAVAAYGSEATGAITGGSGLIRIELPLRRRQSKLSPRRRRPGLDPCRLQRARLRQREIFLGHARQARWPAVRPARRAMAMRAARPLWRQVANLSPLAGPAASPRRRAYAWLRSASRR